jgi:hypothetical protein
MVTHIYNQQAEAGRSPVPGQPELHRRFCLKNKNSNKTKQNLKQERAKGFRLQLVPLYKSRDCDISKAQTAKVVHEATDTSRGR